MILYILMITFEYTLNAIVLDEYFLPSQATFEVVCNTGLVKVLTERLPNAVIHFDEIIPHS